MEAPLHQLCGTRHWSNQPCPADTKETKEAVVALKSKPSSPKAEARARPKPKAKKAGEVARKSVSPASKKPVGSLTSANVKRTVKRATKAIRKGGNILNDGVALKSVAHPAGPKTRRKPIRKSSLDVIEIEIKKAKTAGIKLDAQPKRPAHRPRETPQGFDKPAYMRQYMIDYRARKKKEKLAAERAAKKHDAMRTQTGK